MPQSGRKVAYMIIVVNGVYFEDYGVIGGDC